MKKLGVVLHVSARGDIIVRRERGDSRQALPGLDSVVVNKKLKKIGVVSDIFGPVNSPYISVKPQKQLAINELRAMVNEKVYVRER